MQEADQKTVLLAEDQAAVRSYVRRTLERGGYAVIEAVDGAAAVRAAAEYAGEIDLIITDVVMPNLTGPLAVQQILVDRPALPVLYMSAFAEDEIVVDGEMDPDLPFLAKPFTPDALLESVRELIGGP